MMEQSDIHINDVFVKKNTRDSPVLRLDSIIDNGIEKTYCFTAIRFGYSVNISEENFLSNYKKIH